MARKKAAAPLFDAKTTTAPCVPAIRDKVAAWRTDDYHGATDTTRTPPQLLVPSPTTACPTAASSPTTTSSSTPSKR